MQKDYKIYLLHIRDAIKTVEDFTKGFDRERFLENKLVQDGVIRNLEIIGEASKNIPENVRNKYSDIDWKRMSGMCDILIHDYFGVDLDRIWGVVANRIPGLKLRIEKIIAGI